MKELLLSMAITYLKRDLELEEVRSLARERADGAASSCSASASGTPCKKVRNANGHWKPFYQTGKY